MCRNLLSVAVAAALFSGSLLTVNAIPTLTLSDGTTTITVVDGGAFDMNPGLVGVVGFNNAVGQNWWLNVTTGVTKPAEGSAIVPMMHLNSIDLSYGAGTLVITFTEDGFGPASGLLDITLAPYSANGTVTSETWINGQLINTLTGGTAAVPYEISGDTNVIKQIVTINHTAGGGSSFDAALVPASVPDSGVTLVLLGAALSVVGLIKRKLS